MENEETKFIFNPFNVDIQYCLNNNISYIDVIIIKYINYCLSNYKMIKIKNVNEKGEEIEYVWLDIDVICVSLQMLELSKISMIRRIAKMCDEGKIIKLVKCDEGTKFKKTYYSLPIDTINAINGYENKQYSKIEFNNIKIEKENENTKVDEQNPKQVIDLYHQICTSLPKVVKLTESRKKSINARFKEGITMEMFKEAFTKAQNSSFLTGNNDRGFKADIDFLINANSLTKTLEGKYDNKTTINNSKSYTPKQPTKESGYNYYTKDGIQYREKDGKTEYYQYETWFTYYTPEEEAERKEMSKKLNEEYEKKMNELGVSF